MFHEFYRTGRIDVIIGYLLGTFTLDPHWTNRMAPYLARHPCRMNELVESGP